MFNSILLQLPNFLNINPNFIDLRTIVLKFQEGGYKNADEIIHDLRQIVFSVKHYLQVSIHLNK